MLPTCLKINEGGQKKGGALFLKSLSILYNHPTAMIKDIVIAKLKIKVLAHMRPSFFRSL